MKQPTILFQSPGIAIAFDPVAHTMAPYPGMVRPDGSGTNHGFFDLRGRPELVDDIPEVQEYPCLRSLLLLLSQNNSPFMSLGCDRGPVRESGRSDGWSFAVAAYTTVAFSELTANRSKEDHVKLAHSIWQKFDSQPEKMPVLLNLTVEPLKQLWDIKDAFALDVKMVAFGRTEQESVDYLNWLVPKVAEAFERLTSDDPPPAI